MRSLFTKHHLRLLASAIATVNASLHVCLAPTCPLLYHNHTVIAHHTILHMVILAHHRHLAVPIIAIIPIAIA